MIMKLVEASPLIIGFIGNSILSIRVLIVHFPCQESEERTYYSTY